jgi:hypothetical protein
MSCKACALRWQRCSRWQPPLRHRTDLVREANEDVAYSGRGKWPPPRVIQSLCAHDAEMLPSALLEVLGRAMTEAKR